MTEKTAIDLIPLLEYIDPGMLSYQEWVNVGMALKHEGYTAAHWDEWSRRDAGRYRSGECFKKWGSFNGSSSPVTGASVVDMAKQNGWRSERNDYELGWDDIIGNHDELVMVDKNWIEGKELNEPKDWKPIKDLVLYLETLFESTENVGYVTDSWEKEGRFLPTKGNCDRKEGARGCSDWLEAEV